MISTKTLELRLERCQTQSSHAETSSKLLNKVNTVSTGSAQRLEMHVHIGTCFLKATFSKWIKAKSKMILRMKKNN